ncbi:MAG TPA: pilus assembly protein TadG-related protein, partial [Nocardioidaceae bacterium]|nr:pilus assembly protein TadG-related protein [Nocardioidaceae bacterium]
MTRQRRSQQRGAVAIMVALFMAALCLIAAFTVDLGLVRMDRQQNKSAADSATLAGVAALAPPKKAGTFYPFAGVCAALHYLEANSPSVGSFATSTWTDGNGAATPVDGCDPSLATATCTPNNPSTWARFVGTTSDGRFTVHIQSGYDVSDPSFPEESLPSLQTDTGDPTWGNCDQLAVIVAQTRGTTLGALATSSDGSVIRSVARVTVAPPKDPVSLLVLERHDCQALAITSGGAGGRIEVNGYDDASTGVHLPG